MKVSRLPLLALACALLWPASAASGVRLLTRDVALPAPAARAPAGAERVLSPRLAPERFNLVGLHWRGPGDVEFRTASLEGRFGPWHAARPEAEDRPDRGSAEARRASGWKLGNPYWTGTARRIQLRLSGRVTRLRAHFLWSPVARGPSDTVSLARAPARTLARIPSRPRIVTRAQWGADESLVRDRPSYADRLAFSVVHHTAGASPSSPAQSAAVVRGILAYHVRSNGWSDVGYNFLVDPFGQIFEGRAGGITRNVVGAHAQGFNTGSVGVAVLGTYERSGIAPAARAALVDLLAWRLDLAHVEPVSRLSWVSGGSSRFAAGTRVMLNAVNGHRDVGATSCPGAALYGTLAALAAETAAEGGPKLYDPRAAGSLGSPIRLTARLSASLPWTVTVRDALGAPVATGSGVGTAVDWTWQSAGAAPGRYTYAIEAGAEVRPATGTIGQAVALTLGPLAVRPAVFTPNGDGVSEVAQASVTISAAATLAAWVENGAGERVATLAAGKAVGAGTARVRWSGRAAGGAPAPDGRYRIVVEASAGIEKASASANVVLDRTLGAFRAAPAAFSPNGDGRRDTLALAFTLAREAAVNLRVLRGTRPVVTVVAARLQAGRHALAWDGRASGSPVADGRLRAVVRATTSLGTRVLERAVVLDTAPPRVSALTARRSGRGTSVRFRLSESARVVVALGRVTVTARRSAGVVTLWRRVRPARVTVSAEDAAANRGAPASARVRGR